MPLQNRVMPGGEIVDHASRGLMNPPSIVAAIVAGYRPLVHHSALAGDRPPGIRIQGGGQDPPARAGA